MLKYSLLFNLGETSSHEALHLFVLFKSSLEVREPLFVVLHECLENFADSLNFRGHTLAHPDSSFHVLLLIFRFVSLAKLLNPLQVVLQRGILCFELFALLLHFCHQLEVVLDHFDASRSVLQTHHLLFAPL